MTITTIAELTRTLLLVAQRPSINVFAGADGVWRASVLDHERRGCVGLGTGDDMAGAIDDAIEDFRNELAKAMVAELCRQDGAEI